VGSAANTVTGEILTAKEMSAFNSFENPELVKPVKFNGYKLRDNVLTVTMPAKSVVVLEIK